MGQFESFGAQIAEAAGPDASTSQTFLPTSGAANTKGSWTQLLASTARKSNGMLVFVRNHNSGDLSFTDIGVGAGGSEQVVVPNLPAIGGSEYAAWSYFPISVPAGARIAARTQRGANGSGMTVRIAVHLFAGAWGMPTDIRSAVSYGADTSNTTMTTVTSSGSTNTKGSWFQITASTTREHHWFCVAQSATSDAYFLADIGVGGAGSEQIVVPDIHFRLGSSLTNWMMFPLRIPGGSRIAMRLAGNNATSSSLFSFYGV